MGVKTGFWRDFYNTGQLKRERLYERDELVGEIAATLKAAFWHLF